MGVRCGKPGNCIWSEAQGGACACDPACPAPVSAIKLEDFQGLSGKARRKKIRALTDEQKLQLVDQIINRDAEVWKQAARRYCDFHYYFHYIDGGIALTERQR